MAKKKLTPAQLKDRKTKRLAIGLCVVLVGVLAYQMPTILNVINGGGGSTASAPPATATTPASGTPSGASASSSAAGTPYAPSSGPLAPGSLTEFGSFAGKDPFHAQLGAIVPSSTSPASTTPAAATKGASPKAGKTPTSPTKPKTTKVAPAIPVTAPTTTVPFTTTPPNAAVIMTNGKRQIVPIGKGFPRGAPLFRLVSLAMHPKAIRIGVLGGSFTNGAATMLLHRGAKLELADESNGVHYTIMLVGLTATSPSGTGPSGSSSSSG